MVTVNIYVLAILFTLASVGIADLLAIAVNYIDSRYKIF